MDDMVIFLSFFPEPAKHECTLYMFKLCCFCSNHECPSLLSVRLGSPMPVLSEVDLSAIIEHLQNYFLSRLMK